MLHTYGPTVCVSIAVTYRTTLVVNSILRITKQTGPRAVDRSRLLTNSSDQAAVLDQLDGDVVVVHAGGFRVDAQETAATKQAAAIVVVGVIGSAGPLNTGASAAVSAVVTLA